MRKLNSPHQSATVKPRGSSNLLYIKLLEGKKKKKKDQEQNKNNHRELICYLQDWNTKRWQTFIIRSQLTTRTCSNFLMFSVRKCDNDSCMCTCCWRESRDLCDLSGTNMPLKDWALYYRVRISHRPSPPRGVRCWALQHDSVRNREATVTEKAWNISLAISPGHGWWFSCQTSGTGSTIRLKHAVLSPKVWQLMSIICKTAQ